MEKENYQQKQKSSYSKLSTRSSFSRVNEVEEKLSKAKKLFKKTPEKALDLVHDGLLIAIKENYTPKKQLLTKSWVNLIMP